jgi:hypothetical protein
MEKVFGSMFDDKAPLRRLSLLKIQSRTPLLWRDNSHSAYGCSSNNSE